MAPLYMTWCLKPKRQKLEIEHEENHKCFSLTASRLFYHQTFGCSDDWAKKVKSVFENHKIFYL